MTQFDVRAVAPQCMKGDICRDAQCVRTVAAQGGRYFITMGHPGFNSRANNGNGYATATAAWAASKRYGQPRAQQHPDPETAFEMRAAFGPGVDVVNIITGTKYRT